MRILHIMGRADINGIASTVYSYMSHIDQQSYQFDIALTGNKPGHLGHAMMELGAQVYTLPLKSKGIRAFERELGEILKRVPYDVVHVHSNSTSWVALRVAKRHGIKCRIAHAHSAMIPTSQSSRVKFYSGRILNYAYATRLMACGTEVARYAFGKVQMRSPKVMVLPNGIDSERFRFNATARQEIRTELGIASRYAIGMVGRTSPVKNHAFALGVLKQLVMQGTNAVLVIVGDGELTNYLKAQCARDGLDDSVVFTGSRSDVERIYSALDAFVMPSHYEGMPTAALEALASGLPTYLSTNITRELDFSRNVTYLPLTPSVWVDQLKRTPTDSNREQAYLETRNNGYDIGSCAELLTAEYDSSKR